MLDQLMTEDSPTEGISRVVQLTLEEEVVQLTLEEEVVQLTLEEENPYKTDEEINDKVYTHVFEFNKQEKTNGNEHTHAVEFNEAEKDDKKVEVQVIEKKTFCTFRNARLALITFVPLITGFFFTTTDWRFKIFGLPMMPRLSNVSVPELRMDKRWTELGNRFLALDLVETYLKISRFYLFIQRPNGKII